MSIQDADDAAWQEMIARAQLSIERAVRARRVGYPGDSADEYHESPSRATITWTRIYLPGGTEAHLVDTGLVLCGLGTHPCCVGSTCCCDLKLPADAPLEKVEAALDGGGCACLHELSREDFLGTGSQDEIDHAASLPLCLECFAAREGQLPDERLGTGHHQEMT